MPRCGDAEHDLQCNQSKPEDTAALVDFGDSFDSGDFNSATCPFQAGQQIAKPLSNYICMHLK
jgi:hypothetical protein